MKNVGGIDKNLRIVVGIALIASTFFVPGLQLWGWVGIVPLATGLFNFCPLYPLIGLNTCKECKED